MIGALLGASFAETVWQLVVLQGVLFAFGGVMVYEPTMFYCMFVEDFLRGGRL